MLRALLLASSLLLCVCSKDQGGPGHPVGGECTEIGCVNGLRLGLERAGGWRPGAYVFSFELDDAPVRCAGSLPLKACEGGPSLRCEPEGRVQVGESGCALAPEQHGFSDIQIQGAPTRVRVSIAREGQELHGVELSPTYTESRPNGPACGPVCRGASVQLVVP